VPGVDLFPRRTFIRGSTAASFALLLGACGGDEEEERPERPASPSSASGDGSRTLPATPACDDGDEPTVEQTEGPYFTPDSPERASLLEPGMEGDRLVIAGRVLTTGCRPVRRALLDFWQADAAGEYDNEGFTLRGHQFTDARGRFSLETVVPGLYPGRTRHVHVKVQAPDAPVLTTQLYFPGEPQNDGDSLYVPSLAMAVRRSGGRQLGSFDFVLDV
jgi:protocatechuate 3,4-dioxygenase beta subunit